MKIFNSSVVSLLAIILFGFAPKCYAQQEEVDSFQFEISGILLDGKTKEPLPYANIVIERLNKGGITNEVGKFSMDSKGVLLSDSITFLYIGYKTKKVPITSFKDNPEVLLEEDIKSLNKVFVFATPPNPKDIVKKVLENKDKNYGDSWKREKTFVRNRYVSDINDYELNYKKSTISQIDEAMIQQMEDKTPRHSTSYTDVLMNVYHSGNSSDSNTVKAKSIKTVSLKEKEIAGMEQMEEIFEDVFAQGNKDEYWKFKTGILSFKMDSNDIEITKDTNKPENSIYATRLNYMVKRANRYSSFEKEKDWDFLYSTGKYHYELVGGTNVGDEDVYVIDFTPKGGGLYEGRMYVSVNTYALIRADYQYGVGKVGMDVHILGIGHTENIFVGSVLFERVDSTYELKYCSKKTGEDNQVDRTFALLKKRKRFLLDKTVKEIKVGLTLEVSEEYSFEYLVLDRKSLMPSQFEIAKVPEYVLVTYVDQFDASLWEGYSVIEPTKQMRDYRKKE